MTRWVLWLGGPEMEPTDKHWHEVKVSNVFGHFIHYSACWLAEQAGARIPSNTYDNADPAVSQHPFTYKEVGTNDTAILPLEVDE